MLIDIQIQNNELSGVEDYELRAMASAVLAKAIMDGRNVPVKMTIMLHGPPICVIVDGLTCSRTAELRTNGADDSQIILTYGNRPRELILNSLFHELSHLIRICNNEHQIDLALEEIHNRSEMLVAYPVVGWLSSILMIDHNGELESTHEYAKNEQDPGVSQVVC